VPIADAIHDELEFIRDQLVRQPARLDMLRLVLGGSAPPYPAGRR
jgi:hypothetical protein